MKRQRPGIGHRTDCKERELLADVAVSEGTQLRGRDWSLDVTCGVGIGPPPAVLSVELLRGCVCDIQTCLRPRMEAKRTFQRLSKDLVRRPNGAVTTKRELQRLKAWRVRRHTGLAGPLQQVMSWQLGWGGAAQLPLCSRREAVHVRRL